MNVGISDPSSVGKGRTSVDSSLGLECFFEASSGCVPPNQRTLDLIRGLILRSPGVGSELNTPRGTSTSGYTTQGSISDVQCKSTP